MEVVLFVCRLWRCQTEKEIIEWLGYRGLLVYFLVLLEIPFALDLRQCTLALLLQSIMFHFLCSLRGYSWSTIPIWAGAFYPKCL